MNWQQQIEAQIRWLYRSDCMGGDDFLDAVEQGQLQKASEQMQALLDVAVAAEQHTQSIEEGFAATVRPDIARMQLNRALYKLREVGDE